MRHCRIFIVLGILLMCTLSVPFADAAPFQADVFVGPFPSWKNVKNDYGAVGDGKADDTAALQRAFTDLQSHKTFSVLYFPSGTYRITDTIHTDRKTHTDAMGISIIGEDPNSTIIRWDGKTGGMMVRYDAWYSKISRLTLDGAGRAGVALAYGPSFSTYNETSDMIFKYADIGLQMGTADQGQAENVVLRCQFVRCKNAGLTTVNFNSMDIWVWYSRFEDCGYSLLNQAGNFHAYGNLFLRSQKADVAIENLMVFSIVNNTSVGSQTFLDFRTPHTWGAPTSISGNRILDPAGDRAMWLGNGGPYLVMDNVIRSRPGKTGPEIEMTWGDQTFVGNTYTTKDPVRTNGRFRRIDERILDRGKIESKLPVLPAIPVRTHRPIIEVPAGADDRSIQSAIQQSYRLKGQKPVVHLPKGEYHLRQTITIPAGSDVVLIGDGAAETATVLHWMGEEGGVTLRIQGPRRAFISDLVIDAGRSTGILIENLDEAKAVVSGNQLNVTGKADQEKPQAGLFVNGAGNIPIEMVAMQGGGDQAWVNVRGATHVGIFTGATSTSDVQYRVEQGGKLVVRSVYHEVSSNSPQGILLDDSGTLSIDATRFSYQTSAERPLIKADGFKGAFALLTSMLVPANSQEPARIEIAGDGSATRLLCMNTLFWQNGRAFSSDAVFEHRAKPLAQAGLLLSNQNILPVGARSRDGYAILENRGETEDQFVLELLKPLRESRIATFPDTSEVTGVFLHRVISSAGRNGIGLEIQGIAKSK
jgi:hypothetical protein